MFHFAFWEFSSKGKFISKTIRAVTSFSSTHPRRTRETTQPSCDADARFRRTRAIPSASAFHVFCRRGEIRCERQNRLRVKYRGDQAEKSKASRPSSGQRRELPSAAQQFRRRTISQFGVNLE